MPVTFPSRERTFAYDGFEASVRARPALLGWLAEFLAPWFTVRDGPARAGAPRVEVEAGADALSARLAAAAPAGREVEVYTRDGERAPWPLLRASDGTELAADPSGRVAIEAGPVVRVLAAAERPHGRITAMRVLRELAGAHALARGALPVHGAALADAAGVTLFVGPKQAGKSTLLLHALLQGGARYVANDRVFVEAAARGARARGMPTIVSLREGTLALAPRLRDELGSKAWHHASTIAEARANRASGAAAEGGGGRWPPGLAPAQVCALLGVGACEGGPVARLVFPGIAPELAGARFALRPLAPEQAAERLVAGGLVAGGAAARFLTDAGPVPSEALTAAARALAAAVPAFACALGADAYAAPPVWEAIRAASACRPRA